MMEMIAVVNIDPDISGLLPNLIVLNMWVMCHSLPPELGQRYELIRS